MKTNVEQTSLTAYEELKLTGNLSRQTKKVLDQVKRRYEASCHEIAEDLSIYPSTVSARLNELRKDGLIRYAGKRECKITGKTVMTWKV